MRITSKDVFNEFISTNLCRTALKKIASSGQVRAGKSAQELANLLEYCTEHPHELSDEERLRVSKLIAERAMILMNGE